MDNAAHSDTPGSERDRRALLVIVGVTAEGTRFRPGDWAQRLAGHAGKRNSNGRFRFHSYVRISNIDGYSALIIDTRLAQSDPELYGFFLKFATDNCLKRYF